MSTAPTPTGNGASSTEVNLANPPLREQAPLPGDSELRAQQAAQRFIDSGSLDATTVSASIDDLPYEKLRREQAEVEIAEIPAERAEADAVAAVLRERAKQGELVAPPEGAGSSAPKSLKRLKKERKRTRKQKDAAKQAHDDVLDGLKGTPADDGAVYRGEPVQPGAENPARIARNLRLKQILLIAALAACEGTAVMFNLHEYLRLDDGDFWLPAALTVVVMLILTAAPYGIGVWMNRLVHGGRPQWGHIAASAVAAVFWLSTAVMLAVLRTDVDRAGALAAAEERRDVMMKALQETDPQATLPEVDPGAVFNSGLALTWWIVALSGFGAVILVLEAMQNTLVLAEVERRIALAEAERRFDIVIDWLVAVKGSVTVRKAADQAVTEMYGAEEAVRRVRAERDIRVHRSELIVAAQDPAMALALEQHDRKLVQAEQAEQAEQVAQAEQAEQVAQAPRTPQAPQIPDETTGGAA
ncbi:MAG: hypothetical protein WA971_03890 [Microbacterium sp.]